MKTNNKVIAYKNLPAKLPLSLTAVVYLLMEHFNATELWQGVIWTILGIAWIISIYSIIKQETTDVFEEKRSPQ